MKAISLWQPWAYAWANPDGPKIHETRSWSTKYRGALLIHAAKTFPAEAKFLAQTERTLRRLPPRLAFGAIIGAINLVDVGKTEQIELSTTALDRLYGDFSYGRFAWKKRESILFPDPIGFRGWQGFFDVPEETLIKLTEQLDEHFEWWGDYPCLCAGCRSYGG